MRYTPKASSPQNFTKIHQVHPTNGSRLSSKYRRAKWADTITTQEAMTHEQIAT